MSEKNTALVIHPSIIVKTARRQRMIMANVIHLLPMIAMFLGPVKCRQICFLLRCSMPTYSVHDLIDFCRSITVRDNVINCHYDIHRQHRMLSGIERQQSIGSDMFHYLTDNLFAIPRMHCLAYHSISNLMILIPHEMMSVNDIRNNNYLDFIINYNSLVGMESPVYCSNVASIAHIMEFPLYCGCEEPTLFLLNSDYVFYNDSPESSFILFTGWRLMRYTFDRDDLIEKSEMNDWR